MNKDTDKDITVLNDNFMYNNMLARALMQFFPQEERKQIHTWLEKLQSVSGSKETLTIRNDYVWLLLLVMQCGFLIEPFDRIPPSTEELPSISEVMPAQVYQEILSTSNEQFSWIDEIISETNVTEKERVSAAGVAPYKFLEYQPQPVNGIICYFSVFSKQS